MHENHNLLLFLIKNKKYKKKIAAEKNLAVVGFEPTTIGVGLD